MTQEIPADVQPEPVSIDEQVPQQEETHEPEPRGAFLFAIGLITFYALYFMLTYWEVIILRTGGA